MPSTAITIELESEEKALISDYAAARGMFASKFMRKVAPKRIEDELDLRAWDKTRAEFESYSVTISAAKVAKRHL
jgi:RHH-type rel operon transcriptional repressor/antitoxin RelB